MLHLLFSQSNTTYAASGTGRANFIMWLYSNSVCVYKGMMIQSDCLKPAGFSPPQEFVQGHPLPLPGGSGKRQH